MINKMRRLYRQVFMQEDTEMRDYVITVNSTVDLPKEWLERRHVPVVPLKYTLDGETYTDVVGN